MVRIDSDLVPNSVLIITVTIENGNEYTEVVKLDDLAAEPMGEVDPRFELDLTLKVRWTPLQYIFSISILHLIIL